MANNGLSDLVATLTLPKSEYEDLVRESNTLRILENYINSTKYVDKEVLQAILGIESEDIENGSK